MTRIERKFRLFSVLLLLVPFAVSSMLAHGWLQRDDREVLLQD